MCIRDSDRAVQRGFDRAESFFKNPKFYDDYHKFVLFNVSKEELESQMCIRDSLQSSTLIEYTQLLHYS